MGVSKLPDVLRSAGLTNGSEKMRGRLIFSVIVHRGYLFYPLFKSSHPRRGGGGGGGGEG